MSRQSTYVGPASVSAYGGAAAAIVKAQVLDIGNNQPVASVPVSLANGPSPGSSATTDANGTVIFPALTPNPSSGTQKYYDLAVTPPIGYTALSDDVSPSTAAHVQLSVGQTFNTVLRIYQPATVTVSVTVAGSTYTGAGTVTLTSSRPTLSASLAGGVAQFTGVVPGVQYTANATIGGVAFSSAPQTVPNNYPTDLTSSYALSLPSLVVTVLKKSGTCQAVSGATVTVTGGPKSVNVNTTSASDGTAAFILPAGGSYTIKAKSGATTVTLSGQTIQAAPAHDEHPHLDLRDVPVSTRGQAAPARSRPRLAGPDRPLSGERFYSDRAAGGAGDPRDRHAGHHEHAREHGLGRERPSSPTARFKLRREPRPTRSWSSSGRPTRRSRRCHRSSPWEERS